MHHLHEKHYPNSAAPRRKIVRVHPGSGLDHLCICSARSPRLPRDDGRDRCDRFALQRRLESGCVPLQNISKVRNATFMWVQNLPIELLYRDDAGAMLDPLLPP